MLILHPGFEKTGTTTLQEAVFAQHPGIRNIGRPFDEFGDKFGAALRAPDGEFETDVFAQLSREALGTAPLTVLSNERLVKNFFMRGTIAARLAQQFPQSRVMFTIRNQFGAIESHYGNHARMLKDVPEPFVGRHISIENWLEFAWHEKRTSFIGLCDYERTITMYENLFGPDRVHVLLFEQLRDTPEIFARALGSVLGIDPTELHDLLRATVTNQRDPMASVQYARLRQTFFRNVGLSRLIPFGHRLQARFHEVLARSGRYSPPVPAAWRERLHELYMHGNDRLAQRFGLPLAKYGYPLSDRCTEPAVSANSDIRSK